MAASVASSSLLPHWLARWSSFSPTPPPENIVASEIRAVEDPVHANQRVEKSFTIFAPHPLDATNDPPSDALEVSAPAPGLAVVRSPGLTVVRVRPQLLDEIGPDVVARVRVSSDAEEHLERLSVELTSKRVLCLTYNHATRGAVGHLVTEIDVSRESQIHQVFAMCGGDVVVHDGVLGKTGSTSTSTIADPGHGARTAPDASFSNMLISLYGSRLFLAAPRSDLCVGNLYVGATGTSSVHADVQSLVVAKDLITAVVGSGRIDLDTRTVGVHEAAIAALGSGSVAMTAQHTCYVGSVTAFLKGDGSVRIATPLDAVVEPCLSQKITLGCDGTVDLADVASVETTIAMGRLAQGVVRIRAPREKLTIVGPTSGGASATIHHVGALPDQVHHKNARLGLTALSDEDLDSVRAAGGASEDWRSAVPTIEQAFETPVALDEPREGWFLPILMPLAQGFLPL